MAYAPDYARSFSFDDWQTVNPGEILPGGEIDDQLDAVSTALTGTQTNLRLIQRDDGSLRNAIVGLDQLTEEAKSSFSSQPGPQGPAGPAIPGPAGQSGPIGEAMDILVGSGVPSASIGVLNQTYLNSQNGDWYKKLEGGWTLEANLKGPSGSASAGDHGGLTGLGDPDHPISAVQGLQTALDDLNLKVSGVVKTYVQATAPVAPIPTGSLWFDLDDDFRGYRWNGAQWVDIDAAYRNAVAADISSAINAAAGAQATADGKVVTFVSATTPTAEGVGDLWVDTANANRLMRWNGSAWAEIRDEGIGDALTAASQAQATADGKIVTFYQTTAPATSISSLGDLWFDTDNGNHPYRFNGTNWVSIQDAAITQAAQDASDALNAATSAQAAADGKIDIFYSNTEPGAPADGDLWVDLDGDNQLYRWDGGSSQWVSIRDQQIVQAISDAATAQSTADGKITAYYQNSAPGSADTGDLWYDLDDNNHPYRFNGSAWVSIRDGYIAEVQTLAQDAYNLASASGDAFNIFFQATQPTVGEGLAAGDYWYDTSAGANLAVLYRYDGATFVLVRDGQISTVEQTATDAAALADQKVRVYIQPNDPYLAGDPTSVGDIWFDSDNQNLAQYWSGLNWLPIRDGQISVVQSIAENAESIAQNAQATADGKIEIFYQDAQPGSPSVGDFWVDTNDSNATYRWTGSQWVAVDFNAAAALANDAQATADGKVTLFYQTGEPSGQGESEGDIWIDTDDANKPYVYHSGSWVASTGINDLTGGAVGPGGIQPGATSVETLTEVSDATYPPSALVSNTHASRGNRINVKLKARFVWSSTNAVSPGSSVTVRLRRRINGGAWSDISTWALAGGGTPATPTEFNDFTSSANVTPVFEQALLSSAPESPIFGAASWTKQWLIGGTISQFAYFTLVGDIDDDVPTNGQNVQYELLFTSIANDTGASNWGVSYTLQTYEAA